MMYIQSYLYNYKYQNNTLCKHSIDYCEKQTSMYNITKIMNAECQSHSYTVVSLNIT